MICKETNEQRASEYCIEADVIKDLCKKTVQFIYSVRVTSWW